MQNACIAPKCNMHFAIMQLVSDCYTVVLHHVLFVCVEVLRPSQPSGVMSSSSAVSLPNHTFTGQA